MSKASKFLRAVTDPSTKDTRGYVYRSQRTYILCKAAPNNATPLPIYYALLREQLLLAIQLWAQIQDPNDLPRVLLTSYGHNNVEIIMHSAAKLVLEKGAPLL